MSKYLARFPARTLLRFINYVLLGSTCIDQGSSSSATDQPILRWVPLLHCNMPLEWTNVTLVSRVCCYEIVHRVLLTSNLEITMGDFALMGQCATGAHQNAWNCKGFDYVWGQNLCCARAISATNTFQSIVTAMYGCLQSMWDEVSRI